MNEWDSITCDESCGIERGCVPPSFFLSGRFSLLSLALPSQSAGLLSAAAGLPLGGPRVGARLRAHSPSPRRGPAPVAGAAALSKGFVQNGFEQGGEGLYFADS